MLLYLSSLIVVLHIINKFNRPRIHFLSIQFVRAITDSATSTEKQIIMIATKK